jgi:hypothetical protein
MLIQDAYRISNTDKRGNVESNHAVFNIISIDNQVLDPNS